MKLRGNRQGVQGNIVVPGDKSISHRSIMLASMAEGETKITGFLLGEDCLSTIAMFRQLGVAIHLNGTNITVNSRGLAHFIQPTEPIDVGNSGTTMRLGLGILASCPFTSVITGDESLNKRPMARVMDPLRLMGADVSGDQETQFAPVTISGTTQLKAIDYEMPVASAQVKSAILLAGVNAEGCTIVREKAESRTHTEEMFRYFGVEIKHTDQGIKLNGPQTFKTTGTITVPGDISSAAFFMVAAAILPNSHLTIKNVGLNHSRTGIIDVMKQMGAKMTIEMTDQENKVGNITVETSELTGTIISGDIIPRLIDEIPIIALLATQAKGQTIISDAEELKHKETNRIDTTAIELNHLGAKIEPTEDGLVILGQQQLHGGQVFSHGDHRIGMTLAIASLLVADEDVYLSNPEAIAVSYPEFFKDLEKIKIGGF